VWLVVRAFIYKKYLLYLGVPDEHNGKDIMKYGLSENVMDRFRDSGDVQIITFERVKDIIGA
jgi:hypothetical protein